MGWLVLTLEYFLAGVTLILAVGMCVFGSLIIFGDPPENFLVGVGLALGGILIFAGLMAAVTW